MTAVTADARRIPPVPSLIVSGLGLIAVAVVLCACALGSPLPSHAAGFGSVALACYASGLLCLVSGRRGDLGLARWKLGPWLLLWCAVAGGLATAAWNPPQGTAAAVITMASVLRALWLLAAGMTCWAAGYAAGPGAPARNAAARGISALAARRGDIVRGPLTPWLLYAAGTCARLATLATTGRLGYVGNASSALSGATGYGQVVTDLGLLAPLAVSAAALQVYRERRPGARVTLGVLCAAEIAWGVLAGQKQDFIVAVLAVAIPAAGARARLPKAVMAAALAVFLIVIVPFTLAYRAAARGGVTLSASQATAQAPGILRQAVTGPGALTAVPASLDYLLQRVQEIGAPALIMQKTPSQIPYASPAQLVTGPLTEFVPRALWPGKPVLATGYQVSQEYYDQPASVYSAAAVTPAGDLWRHGGWVPVIAGMFLLGCAVRLLDDALDVRASPHAVFLLVLLFPFVKSETDWTGLLAGIPATGAVWLLAVTLAFRPAGPRRRRTTAWRSLPPASPGDLPPRGQD